MARRRKASDSEIQAKMVSFKSDDGVYQIDTIRQKVYRKFVEIESAKAFEIYARWRAQEA